MRHLQIALKKESVEEDKSQLGTTKSKSKGRLEKWSLDPDIIEHKDQESKIQFKQMTLDLLTKKFENEKYIQEVSYLEILMELNDILSDLPNQLQRLTRIEDTLNQLAQSFTGQMKNNLKHLQSLLDAKLRKLKRREKKTELTEFDRIAALQKPMKRKQQPLFINEDEREIKLKIKNKDRSRLQSRSKKSFGTIGSIASNENQSVGSGKNYSGSSSRSGQAKALSVLLANIQPKDDKKNQKKKQKEKEQYDFSSVLCASISIRQRSPVHKKGILPVKEVDKTNQMKTGSVQEDDMDQAFIFHRPKTVRRGKF